MLCCVLQLFQGLLVLPVVHRKALDSPSDTQEWSRGTQGGPGTPRMGPVKLKALEPASDTQRATVSAMGGGWAAVVYPLLNYA